MLAYSRLRQFSPIPIYGTLLGLAREGHPIENDDDVDFLVHASEIPGIMNFFEDYEGVSVLIHHSKSPFVRVTFSDFPEIPIDLYGYKKSGNSLWESWNFLGLPMGKLLSVSIPLSDIFPLSKIYVCDEEILVPGNAKGVCRRLYGQNWQTPKAKTVDYKTLAVFGRIFTLTGASKKLFMLFSWLFFRIGFVKNQKSIGL